MYYAKVYVDEDDRTILYINVIEEFEGMGRRIAWISVRGRNIYKSVKQPIPIVGREEGRICVQDSSYRDVDSERADPIVERPWYEMLSACLARLSLPAALEQTVRDIAENPSVASAPAQHFVTCSRPRDLERLHQSRVAF